MQHRQALGQWAEQQARTYLETQGYEWVTSNYHSRMGELDLVMQREQVLVFVEVKARTKGSYLQAIETILPKQQLKIMKTALLFIQQHPQFEQYYCRFDVICFDFKQQFAKTIQLSFCDYTYDLQWIENAFTFDSELINL